MNKKQLIVALLLLTTTAIAQDEHPVDKSLSECMAKTNSVTSEMVACLEKAYSQWGAEIDKYYNLLMGILPEKSKIKLKKSQSAWIKFRDLEFEAIPDIYAGIIGSFQRPTFLEHKVNILRARALQLKDYYERTKDDIRTWDINNG